jgi:hypothetical protein
MQLIDSILARYQIDAARKHGHITAAVMKDIWLH